MELFIVKGGFLAQCETNTSLDWPNDGEINPGVIVHICISRTAHHVRTYTHTDRYIHTYASAHIDGHTHTYICIDRHG